MHTRKRPRSTRSDESRQLRGGDWKGSMLMNHRRDSLVSTTGAPATSTSKLPAQSHRKSILSFLIGVSKPMLFQQANGSPTHGVKRRMESSSKRQRRTNVLGRNWSTAIAAATLLLSLCSSTSGLTLQKSALRIDQHHKQKLRTIQMKFEGMFVGTTPSRNWMIPVMQRIPSTTLPQGKEEEEELRTSIRSRPKLIGQAILGFDVRRSTSSTKLQSSTSSSSEQQQQQQKQKQNTDTNSKKRGSIIVLPSSLSQTSYKRDTTADASTTNKIENERARAMDAMTVVQLKEELSKYGLAKRGSKAVLQERLRNHLEVTPLSSSSPNKELAGMVDIAAILQRRKEIHKQKSQPYQDKSPPIDTLANARQVLQKIYKKPSSSLESSQHASRVYQAAKEADQLGDRNTAKYLLRSLDSSHDARILRRLARLEHEDGNTELAQKILHEGLSTHHQNNPFLWHGLASLEDSVDAKRQCYQRAIEADPHTPHSYHALATLEHTEGRIKPALEVLKTGLKYCPTNNRLYHALGDLYRDAKVLKRATASYHKAMEYGPSISHGYAMTALAFCAYEDNNMELCREYLQQAIDHNPRQANAWMSLAQFEESLGNVDVARKVCRTAVAQYEFDLLKKYPPTSNHNGESDTAREVSDPVAYKNDLLRNVPRKRSGDKFIHVYRTWMRMEGRYGTRESFEEVFQQASAAFTDVRIVLDAAYYYAGHGLNELARKHFMVACKSSSRSVDAFRIFGLHEMMLDNVALAERIFYTGAMTGRSYGLAELLYAWAVCQWRTDQHQNAASLFQQAIEETGDNVRLRSFILYVSARFEFSRGEYHRAQHFVGRCLSVNPNHMPGGNEQVWTLWKKIAEAMGDERLAQHCNHQAWKSVWDDNEATRVQQGDFQQQIRRDPWISKVYSLKEEGDSLYNLNILPKDDIALFENSLLSDESLVKS